ncbi:FKBP-type peptidyl-prolyl cis-trans isomerase [Parasphingorhabdus sp. DH2-15]|uniref:FKBP-type peptidyl-prolyl cis-trans isomerase n=1 Tax=Parasphingorhabdus sp. DH2-15 TaxID=3444112 RepID=UPI003F682986
MSVTRVPIQPIAKGSLTKLWLGVAFLILIGAGLAWASTAAIRGNFVTTESGVKVFTLEEGEDSASPASGDVALVNYEGRLLDGTVFDSNQQVPFSLAGKDDPAPPPFFPTIIPGLREGILQMNRGGKYRVVIPSELGYGDVAQGEIPPNSDLEFEIELIDFRSLAELEAQLRQQQQLQQGLPPGVGGPPGGIPGGPGGPVGPPPGVVPPQ